MKMENSMTAFRKFRKFEQGSSKFLEIGKFSNEWCHGKQYDYTLFGVARTICQCQNRDRAVERHTWDVVGLHRTDWKQVDLAQGWNRFRHFRMSVGRADDELCAEFLDLKFEGVRFEGSVRTTRRSSQFPGCQD